MSKLRRYFASGQICFVTFATHERQPILMENIDILRHSYRVAHSRSDLIVHAWVVLPDHIHALIESPTGAFSSIIGGFKLSFSLKYNERYGLRGPVWQRRFWDHIIRSESEFISRLDYIHNNPVRHELVESAEDWKYSSNRRRRLRR